MNNDFDAISHRSGLRRPVRAAPPARRDGPLGAGLRRRQRRRRHLVVQPLPGCTGRWPGQPLLLLHVLGGAHGGVGLDRDPVRAGSDGARLPRARRRSLRPPKDIQFETWVEDARYDEAAQRWTVETDTGERASAQFLICAVGALSTRTCPTSRASMTSRASATTPAAGPTSRCPSRASASP